MWSFLLHCVSLWIFLLLMPLATLSAKSFPAWQCCSKNNFAAALLSLRLQQLVAFTTVVCMKDWCHWVKCQTAYSLNYELPSIGYKKYFVYRSNALVRSILLFCLILLMVSEFKIIISIGLLMWVTLKILNKNRLWFNKVLAIKK